MENELKIEHLTPYLPYGLRFSLSRSRDEFICTGLTVEDDGIMAHNIKGCCNVSLGSYYKPILRPMSYLTKEIGHKGEKFIPIIELAKDFHIPSKYAVTHYDGIFDYGSTGIGCKCFVDHSNSRYSEFSIYGEELITHNDFRIVQKIIEWHFDVFCLIPSGLAIDINTLNEPK